MDKETKELLNAIISELDRVEGGIKIKLDEMNDKIEKMQQDITVLKARNDFTDLFALYNQLDRRLTALEQKVS